MTAAEASHHPSPSEPSSLQGLAVSFTDDATRVDVLEKAFDFRGDCTLTLTDGRTIAGYIFDRRKAAAGAPAADASLRLMTATSDDKVSVRFGDVAKIEFGKDTAAGKSFETWIKKYVEKKMKGEKASIESETL